MTDSASSSFAGYLFQLEKALILLSKLDSPDDYVSIEDVDDVATHKENGTVLVSLQGKHSISNSGSTFDKTSYALWRTLQLWVQKLERGIFNSDTEFICSTNKKIDDRSFLKNLTKVGNDAAIASIEDLLENQKGKLGSLRAANPKSGKHTEEIIDIIEEVLEKKTQLKIILQNLRIDDEVNLRTQLETALNISNGDLKSRVKDSVIETMLGWITYRCLSLWRGGDKARLTKEAYDSKYQLTINMPSIIKAIFRNKKDFEKISEDVINMRKGALFVRQIEDLKRNKEHKEVIIADAIQDFTYYEIELADVIRVGDFSQPDFESFEEACKETWKASLHNLVTRELEEYSEEELNEIGIRLYNEVIYNSNLHFFDISFTMNNKYIRNGCFLHLSDRPIIGWHPIWEKKYKA